MKIYNLIFLGFILIFFSCKKSNVEPDEKGGDQNRTVTEVYGGTLFNDASSLITSFSGNYMVIKSNTANKLYQYSSDGGATWQNIDKNKIPTELNDEGYFIYNNGGSIGKFGTANPNLTYSLTGGQLILGKKDYLYDLNIANKKLTSINVKNNTETIVNEAADTLGKFCGQDQNGGIAFINNNGLSVHQPASNSWIFHPFNIVRIYFTSSNVSYPSKIYYNGFDKLVIADKKGFQVYQIGQKNPINNFDWPGAYANYYLNPHQIEINKGGEVMAMISTYGGKPFMFKIANGNMVAYPRATYTVCKGEYTYEMSPLAARKLSAGKTESINGLIKEARGFKNAYITTDKVYAIYQIDPEFDSYNGLASSGADTVLCYDRKTKTTKFLNVSGNFSFVYQDGNQVMVSGNNTLMYSVNQGDTWEKVNSAITANLIEVKKIGNTYYGLCKVVSSYTSTYGTSYSNSFKMISSTDLKNWNQLPGASYNGKAGMGPSTFTKDGFMSYISQSVGGLIFKSYSTDFGKTWESTSDFVVVFTAELNDGKLVNFNHNGGTELYYEYYQRVGIGGTLKGRITYKAPADRSFTISTPRVPAVGADNSFYFFNDDKIYKLD